MNYPELQLLLDWRSHPTCRVVVHLISEKNREVLEFGNFDFAKNLEFEMCS